ncbi:MAG: DUF104 domain-containing protein [Candidatus Woesearchaeota archaeon]|nr:DUF104 domain-containing protein [Candidatus Woesearchaeota archaeon]
MATEIEGIYKNGKILPMNDIKLEENTKVTVMIHDHTKNKSFMRKLIGAWENVKEMDGIFNDILKRRHKDIGRKVGI